MVYENNIIGILSPNDIKTAAKGENLKTVIFENWSDTIKVQCQSCRKREEERQ